MFKTIRNSMFKVRKTLSFLKTIFREALANRQETASLVMKGLRTLNQFEFGGFLTAIRRKYRSRLSTFDYYRTVYSVNKTNFAHTLTAIHQAEWENIGEDLVLLCSGDDPHVETPLLDLSEADRYWLRLKMSFPTNTLVQFFFSRDGSLFNETDSIKISVFSGEQILNINIPNPNTVKRIRFDPGVHPGRYVLKGFSIVVPHRDQTTPPMIQRIQPQITVESFLGTKIDPYEAWLATNEWNDRCEKNLLDRLDACGSRLSKISVIVPVFNPSIEFLEKMIQSVERQVYQNWELLLVDDKSKDYHVRQALERAAIRDPRIKAIFRNVNGGISEATNSGAELATGEFLAFVDHDDEITSNALGEIALYEFENPEVDFIYSDEDKTDVSGRRYDPHFKPDWSPDLFLTHNYINHLVAIRKRLFHEVGGLRKEYDLCQDHDLGLRATEHARKVGHLPMILYHWRALPDSGAFQGDAKPESYKREILAVQDALRRRKLSGKAFIPDWARRRGNVLSAIKFPDEGPWVTIIIPTKNNLRVLERCMDSLRKTAYQNYEIVIVDNESDMPEMLNFLESLSDRLLRIPNKAGKFNFSFINNDAVRQISSDYVLFLNDDTEVADPQWLSQMMGYAQMEGVGAVGAKLLFPDGSIQHSGVVHGVYRGIFPAHALRGFPDDHLAYMFVNRVTRNCSAVTAACMLTPRKLFLDLGGFDEENFGVQYNDVDYCYRLLERGYRVVQCSDAVLTHHESISRGHKEHNLEENLAYLEKYGKFSDPYYNPNLSLHPLPRYEIRPRKVVRGNLKPIRTLLCSHNLNLEGAPYYMFELASSFGPREVINPVVLSPIDGPMRAMCGQAGIPVQVMTCDILNNEQYEKWFADFTNFVHESGVELVFVNTVVNWHVVDACGKLGIPCLWNIHESEGFAIQFGSLPFDSVEKAAKCFSIPYQVIFGSYNTREVWSSLDSKHNFEVIHNFLEPDRLAAKALSRPHGEARASLGLLQDDVAILLLGTVCERKGQLDLVHAIQKVPEKVRRKLRCFIVGDW